jgi:hypothetical protein
MHGCVTPFAGEIYRNLQIQFVYIEHISIYHIMAKIMCNFSIHMYNLFVYVYVFVSIYVRGFSHKQCFNCKGCYRAVHARTEWVGSGVRIDTEAVLTSNAECHPDCVAIGEPVGNYKSGSVPSGRLNQ